MLPVPIKRNEDVPGSVVFIHQCGHIVVPEDPAVKAHRAAMAKRKAQEESHAKAMRNAAKQAARMQAQQDLRMQQQHQQHMQQQQHQQHQQQFIQSDAIQSFKPKTTFLTAPIQSSPAHFAPMTISTQPNMYSPPPSGQLSYDPRGPAFMQAGLPPTVMQTNYPRIQTYTMPEQPQDYSQPISYHPEANTFAKIKI